MTDDPADPPPDDGGPPADEAGAAFPRSSLQLLLDRTYGPYFGGRLLWATGVWVYTVAAAIVVFDLTRSTLFVGLVSVAHFLPQMLLSPWSGAQADRGDRRKQVVVGRVISGSASSALVLWILTIGLEGTAGAFAIVVAALLTGIGDALGAPAAHALVPAMVRRNELPAAVALDSVPFTAARAIGPALGALLIVTLGPLAAFGFSAFASFSFAVIVLLLRIRKVVTPPGAHDRSVSAGLRYVRSTPALGALLLGVATIGLGVDPVVTLTPAIADGLGGGERLVGWLAATFGVGAGLGFLLLGAIRRWLGIARQGSIGLATIAVGLGLLAASMTPAAAVISLTVAGIGYTVALTALTTRIQQLVDESMRGRVMALWAVAFLGSRPVAAALNGVVADTLAPVVAVLVTAVFVVVGAVLVRPSRTSGDGR
ncbi:MAG: MFS transporter [Nitriliruptoraceae bacterium]|nr:MFS transporter [Nitriliruptoraceae bacterium]